MTVGRVWRAVLLLCAAALSLPLASAASANRPDPASSDRQIMVMVVHPADHLRPGAIYGGGYGDNLARSARERLARRIARHYQLTLVDNWPMPMIGVDCFVMTVPDGRSTEQAIEQVSHDSSVEWAQPVQLFQARSAAATHNDPLYRTQPAALQWRLADLHRMATGRGVKVAVIDSAIEVRHPDLAGQFVGNRDFTGRAQSAGEQHGTGVAGIIAAKADNRIGLAGMAPGARLLGLRACWSEAHGKDTQCDSFSLAKALYFAIEQKADVINLSLSGPGDRLLRDLINIALARGSAVVAAFDPARRDGGFPASVSGAFAVSDTALAASRGSVYTAPGRDVPTTQPGGRWYLVNGSSFAAAHVSGLLALVRERRTSAAPALVSDRDGGGAIDACATLARLSKGVDSCSTSFAARASLRP